MRRISAKEISDRVAQLCIKANYRLGKDVKASLKQALRSETSARAKLILKQILHNAAIAERGTYPLCQDTGIAWFMVEMGAEARISGGDITGAINAGVKAGYREGYLRKSMVCDPLERANTKTNLPATIHVRIVKGERIRINFAPKGGGSENMSRAGVLTPASGEEGIINYVVETVKQAGGSACPPLVIGVGLGGSLDSACLASKMAFFRKLGTPNRRPAYRRLEQNTLKKINALSIGPMGMGGKTTALAVHLIAQPCHIASMPIAVSLNCHSHRHALAII